MLAYGPRSKGRSSRTLEGRTYSQHGQDLRAFLEALKLKDPIVVGWSWGCHDGYGYFQSYGTDNVRAFVCIDQTPRSIALRQGDWAEFGDASEAGALLNDIACGRRHSCATSSRR